MDPIDRGNHLVVCPYGYLDLIAKLMNGEPLDLHLIYHKLVGVAEPNQYRALVHEIAVPDGVPEECQFKITFAVRDHVNGERWHAKGHLTTATNDAGHHCGPFFLKQWWEEDLEPDDELQPGVYYFDTVVGFPNMRTVLGQKFDFSLRRTARVCDDDLFIRKLHVNGTIRYTNTSSVIAQYTMKSGISLDLHGTMGNIPDDNGHYHGIFVARRA
jgi:hypothetical protein